MMGLMFEIMSEENPEMVVTIAKKVGVAFLSTVMSISFSLLTLGYLPSISL